MFWNDHRPPHFHAEYGCREAVVRRWRCGGRGLGRGGGLGRNRVLGRAPGRAVPDDRASAATAPARTGAGRSGAAPPDRCRWLADRPLVRASPCRGGRSRRRSRAAAAG
ncbi:hypothetical protein [Candidatus Poriferisodalis multihospitum]|uniref:hypothetical protein n=1 Tax=Candidatus Poriferisodalis multihospitum TaxID=2983191 RepID=UPI002B263A2F|nr:hypothetical protein [Candidatus Poriferisodalis multihospitum]